MGNLNVNWSDFWFSEKFSASTCSRCCVWTVTYWTMFLRKNYFFCKFMVTNIWKMWNTNNTRSKSTPTTAAADVVKTALFSGSPIYIRTMRAADDFSSHSRRCRRCECSSTNRSKAAVERSNWWFIFKTGHAAYSPRLDLKKNLRRHLK